MPSTLHLLPVGTYSASAADAPVPIIYAVAGGPADDSVHIERLGETEFRWFVVWYRRQGDEWRRVAFERFFPTAEEALDAVAIALSEPPGAGPQNTASAAGV